MRKGPELRTLIAAEGAGWSTGGRYSEEAESLGMESDQRR